MQGIRHSTTVFTADNSAGEFPKGNASRWFVGKLRVAVVLNLLRCRGRSIRREVSESGVGLTALNRSISRQFPGTVDG